MPKLILPGFTRLKTKEPLVEWNIFFLVRKICPS
jgi:hypothetical protein